LIWLDAAAALFAGALFKSSNSTLVKEIDIRRDMATVNLLWMQQAYDKLSQIHEIMRQDRMRQA
jgi:hypothetical protein